MPPSSSAPRPLCAHDDPPVVHDRASLQPSRSQRLALHQSGKPGLRRLQQAPAVAVRDEHAEREGICSFVLKIPKLLRSIRLLLGRTSCHTVTSFPSKFSNLARFESLQAFLTRWRVLK